MLPLSLSLSLLFKHIECQRTKTLASSTGCLGQNSKILKTRQIPRLRDYADASINQKHTSYSFKHCLLQLTLCINDSLKAIRHGSLLDNRKRMEFSALEREHLQKMEVNSLVGLVCFTSNIKEHQATCVLCNINFCQICPILSVVHCVFAKSLPSLWQVFAKSLPRCK